MIWGNNMAMFASRGPVTLTAARVRSRESTPEVTAGIACDEETLLSGLLHFRLS